MINTILVDDDVLSMDMMCHMLQIASLDIQVVGMFQRAEDACKSIERNPVDLVFLDIEMPGTNGLEAANLIQGLSEDLLIVFVTAHTEFALDAFKTNAIDYMVKPFSVAEIKRVLDKVRFRMSRSADQAPGNRQTMISRNRILMLGSLIVYSAFHDEPIRTTETITELLAYLVCFRNHPINKFTLCEMFWPEQNPEQALHNLYTAVYRLKRILNDDSFPMNIKSHHGFYHVDLGDCLIDYEIIQNLARQDSPVTPARLPAYEMAESLYRGALLEIHSFNWAMPLAEKIEHDYQLIAMKMIQYHRKASNFKDALLISQKLERIFPYDEDVQTMINMIHADRRDTYTIQEQIKLFKSRLSKDLSAGPSEIYIRTCRSLLDSIRG